jgi:hypothetical protein
LFITFSVYAYRDIWPLLTFKLVPADGREGTLLWIKIGLVAVAGVIPLVSPRQYVPLDPQVRCSFFPHHIACPLTLLCRILRSLLIQSRRHPIYP